ncbi:ribonucleoside-diphosphate reductase subunit alpha [Dyella telluris]|nr:ribonucleoside-diphosphate reductase subunit alpha [Dyella telluris]
MNSPIKQRAVDMRAKIKLDPLRDALLTAFGKETLERSYLLKGESYQELFARVAGYYADDEAHAQRLYDYISQLWFMPATPVLSNGGTTRGMPISCFLNDVQDSMPGILDSINENAWLASKGGGIGTYWGEVRSMGEKVGHNGQTTGIIPFIKVQDSMTLAISQGSLRRGSAAVYLQTKHPEIDEFLEIRKPTGGDPNRKALNIHNGAVVDDGFMFAVEKGTDYDLVSPKDGHTVRTIKARNLWSRMLDLRMETGEPYMLFIDNVNRAIPAHHKKLGLFVKQSNLCAEITLFTGKDHLGNMRTAVCCLSSVNLEKWDEWKDNPQFIEDILRFLDNVLEDFIQNAPPEMSRAVYAAKRERSVGLGVMGFHAYLQKMGVAIESDLASLINKEMHSRIKVQADAANLKLAEERGSNPDAVDAGMVGRFSNMLAHAPTASISVIAGTTSPSTEARSTNAFLQKTLSGSFIVRNPYLAQRLDLHGKNDEATWQSIVANKGSVQHLDFLSDEEKKIFRTAFEIDQRWMIKHAAERQPYICQSQSLNLFLHADTHKRELHDLHMYAWKSGVKSLYYCRSTAVKRAEAVNVKVAQKSESTTEETKYDECLACQ